MTMPFDHRPEGGQGVIGLDPAYCGTSSTDPSPNLDFDLHRGRISCLLDTASKFFYNARIRRHYSIRANRTGYVIAVTPSQLRQS